MRVERERERGAQANTFTIKKREINTVKQPTQTATIQTILIDVQTKIYNIAYKAGKNVAPGHLGCRLAESSITIRCAHSKSKPGTDSLPICPAHQNQKIRNRLN